MAPNKRFDPEILRKLIRYDPETGDLIWRARLPDERTSNHQAKRFTTVFAGKPALNCINRGGYKVGTVLNIRTSAHRVAWAIYHGVWPEGEIDHINHIRSDNRIKNLREVSSAQNARNRSLHRNNKSGFVGVFWIKKLQIWRVTIRYKNQIKFLGHFKCKEDAIEERKKANLKFGYHENHGSQSINL